MDELLNVVKVDAKDGHLLFIRFENGEERVFDMAPYFEGKAFAGLRDPVKFAEATVEYGTVVWPGGLDIAPETLYDRSRPINTSNERGGG